VKLYRNHLYLDFECSIGFRWFASKKEAVQDAKNEPELYTGELAEIAEEISFEPTKKGILRLLEKVARYPDNG